MQTSKSLWTLKFKLNPYWILGEMGLFVSD